MPTIQDVAYLAGVSSATVSRVINGSDKVSEKVKSKVQDAIEKLNYTPNSLGLYLRSSSTKSLLFLIQEEIILDYKFITGINSAAFEHGYNVVMAMMNGSPELEADFLRRVKNRLYDGVIFCMNPYNSKELHDMFEDFPCVFASTTAGDFIPSFSIDHEQAAYEATNSLIRSGCREISLFAIEEYTNRHGKTKKNTDDLLHIKGYRRALEANGIAFREELIIQSSFSYEGSRQSLIKLLSEEHPADAVLCTHEQQAFACISAAKELGISVPQELSVLCFNVSNICEIYNPRISTVSQPWYDIGYEAVSALINNISNPGAGIYGPCLLPHSIIQRDTTRPST